MAETIKAKLVVTAKTGKGFKVEGYENWFSVRGAEIEKILASITKGEEIEITYDKKGVFYNVSKIVKSSVEKQSGYKCISCGTSLKDGKYKKCYKCNQKKEEPSPKDNKPNEDSPKSRIVDEPPKTGYDKYNNPEKTAQIQRGNALNAAATVMSNPNLQMSDTSPEALSEATKVIAQAFLDWLRVE